MMGFIVQVQTVDIYGFVYESGGENNYGLMRRR